MWLKDGEIYAVQVVVSKVQKQNYVKFKSLALHLSNEN